MKEFLEFLDIYGDLTSVRITEIKIIQAEIAYKRNTNAKSKCIITLLDNTIINSSEYYSEIIAKLGDKIK